jgi:hypothetical protein
VRPKEIDNLADLESWSIETLGNGREILKSLHFKRPLMKTIRYYFGDDMNIYGGKKGFSDLISSTDKN